MNKCIFIPMMVLLTMLSVLSVQAQHLEVGLSPFALAYRLSSYGSESYNNSYHLLIEYGTSDTTHLLYQARYDVFDGNDLYIDGDDKSFHNLGIGARYRFFESGRFNLSAFATVGCLLIEPHNLKRASVWYKEDTTNKVPYRSRVPSLVNLSTGLNLSWQATVDVEPYIEASILNSLRLQSDEKTRVELFAVRIGVRFKV